MTISNTFHEEYDMAAVQNFLGYFTKLAELPPAYNRLQAELEATNRRLDELVQQVKTLTQSLGDKSRELAENRDELRRTSDWLQASRESNTQLREQIRTKDTEIATLRGTVSDQEARHRQLDDVIAAHEGNHKAKDAVIADLTAENDRLRQRIDRMVAVARGLDQEVPTVDKVVAQEQAKEAAPDPLSAGETVPASPSAPDVGTSEERTTTQQPINTEYEPAAAKKEGWPSDQGFRPFAHATTTDHSGVHQSSQSTPDDRDTTKDGRYDPDLDPRYNFA